MDPQAATGPGPGEPSAPEAPSAEVSAGGGGRGHPQPRGLEAVGLTRRGERAHPGNAGAARVCAEPGR